MNIVEVQRPGLLKGTMVKMTKVHIFNGEKSNVKVGKTYYGALGDELKTLRSMSIVDPDGCSRRINTSSVNKITTTAGSDFIIETDTSVYLLQRI